MWWLAWIALAVFAAVWPFIVTDFKLDVLRRNGHLPPKYEPETTSVEQTPPANPQLALPAPNGPRSVPTSGPTKTTPAKRRDASYLKLVADNGPVRKRS